MTHPEALHQRMNSLEELRGIVRSMKSLSAASIRQFEQAVEALAQYYRTVELGLQALERTSAISAARQRVKGKQVFVVIRLGSRLVRGFQRGCCKAFMLRA